MDSPEAPKPAENSVEKAKPAGGLVAPPGGTGMGSLRPVRPGTPPRMGTPPMRGTPPRMGSPALMGTPPRMGSPRMATPPHIMGMGTPPQNRGANDKCLNNDNCLRALAELRHSKWFQVDSHVIHQAFYKIDILRAAPSKLPTLFLSYVYSAIFVRYLFKIQLWPE